MVLRSQMDAVIGRLIKLGAPKEPWLPTIAISLKLHGGPAGEWVCSKSEAFVMLVLLTSWLSIASLDEKPYDILETFAGVAQIARAGRLCNMKTAATDIAYESSALRKGGWT